MYMFTCTVVLYTQSNHMDVLEYTIVIYVCIPNTQYDHMYMSTYTVVVYFYMHIIFKYTVVLAWPEKCMYMLVVLYTKMVVVLYTKMVVVLYTKMVVFSYLEVLEGFPELRPHFIKKGCCHLLNCRVYFRRLGGILDEFLDGCVVCVRVVCVIVCMWVRVCTVCV